MLREAEEARIQSVWGRMILAFVFFIALSTFFVFTFFLLIDLPEKLTEGSPEGVVAPEVAAEAFQDPVVFVGVLLLQAVAGVLAVLGMTLVVDRRPLASLGFAARSGSQLGGLAWGLMLGTVLASALVLFISATGGRHLRPELFAETPSLMLVTMLVTLLLAGFMEEWFFRGYLYVNAREKYGVARTIVLTSIAFAAIHVNNPGAQPLGWINIFLVGVVLAQLREVSGGLLVPIGLHVGWNLALGMGYGAQVSGISLPSVLRVSLHDLPTALGGGEFGPEASAVLTVLFGSVALWLARRLMPKAGESL